MDTQCMNETKGFERGLAKNFRVGQEVIKPDFEDPPIIAGYPGKALRHEDFPEGILQKKKRALFLRHLPLIRDFHRALDIDPVPVFLADEIDLVLLELLLAPDELIHGKAPGMDDIATSDQLVIDDVFHATTFLTLASEPARGVP